MANVMPYRKKIAEAEQNIEVAAASIARQRALVARLSNRKLDARKAETELDKLLAVLARLRAGRVRLLARQVTISK